MKRTLLSLLASCALLPSFSQALFTKEIRTLSNSTYNNLKTVPGGGYIACADIYDSLNGYTRVCLIRFDALGGTLWSRSYPRSAWLANLGNGGSVDVTNDGGFVIGTVFDAAQGAPYNKYWTRVIRTDSLGNVTWAKDYTFPGGLNSCMCIRQTSDLGFIACGMATDTVSGARYNYLLKIDGAGVMQWSKTYFDQSNWGGSTVTVIESSGGGYVFCGQGYIGMCIVKTDNAGNVAWSRTLNPIGADVLTGLRETSDGGYILTGAAETADAIVVKLTAAGTVQWCKLYDTPGPLSNPMGYDIIESPPGYTLLSTASQDHALVRIDPLGQVTWARAYQQTFEGASGVALQRAPDGGYAFSTIWYTPAGSGFTLLKTDSLGHACQDTSVAFQVNSYNPGSNTGFGTAAVTGSATVSITAANPMLADTMACFSGVGMVELAAQNALAIFPNPSNGMVTLRLPGAGTAARLKVTSMLGETVMENKLPGDQWLLDVTGLANGIYFITVETDRGETATAKLVKE